MYRKYKLIAMLIAIIAVKNVYAQGEISIGFYNKSVYVTNSNIYLKVTLKNDSPDTWRFKLADDKRMSINFDVRTMDNRKLNSSIAYRTSMAGNFSQFYREMALEPGEEYSFVELLSNYVEIKNPGAYIITSTMYPELSTKKNDNSIVSNKLNLSIRPSVPTPEIAEVFREETTEIIHAENIAPDDVVSRTITARQKSKWNEFFLYLDVERLLLTNKDKSSSYIRESDDGRRRMLSNYRTELMASVVDQDIVMIPSSYEIIETKYNKAVGTVIVLEKFDYSDFKWLKEYTYYLEKKDNIWYIVGYNVRNVGTE